MAIYWGGLSCYDFPSAGGVHTRFRLWEVSDPSVELTSVMEINFINMVRWRRQRDRDLAVNPLHRWLAWLDSQSPPEFVEEVKRMDNAIAVADEMQAFVMSDDEARELYEMRQKAEMDRRSEIAFAAGESRQEGERKGRQERDMELLALLDKGYTVEDLRRELASR